MASAGHKFRVGGTADPFNAPWHTIGGCEWTDYSNGELCKALNSGELDVALLEIGDACLNIMQGGKHRIIGLFLKCPVSWGVYVHKGKYGEDFKSITDLKGCRHAITKQGSNAAIMAHLQARQLGWDPVREMQFVIVDGVNGATKALKEGRADVFLWERVENQNLSEYRQVAELRASWPRYVVAASTSVLESKSTELLRLLDRMRKECRAFTENENGKTADFLAKNSSLDRGDAEAWLKGACAAADWVCKPAIPEELLLNTIDTLVSGGAVDAADVCDPSSLVSAFTKLHSPYTLRFMPPLDLPIAKVSAVQLQHSSFSSTASALKLQQLLYSVS
jgi:hypothetical protein